MRVSVYKRDESKLPNSGIYVPDLLVRLDLLYSTKEISQHEFGGMGPHYEQIFNIIQVLIRKGRLLRTKCKKSTFFFRNN